MIRLKKGLRDDVLQLALLLSLLRVDPGWHVEDIPMRVGIATDDSWDYFGGSAIGPRFHIHPKAVQREIFDDLNALGRYNRIALPRNITAYLLNVDGGEIPPARDVPESPDTESTPPDDQHLSQEVSHFER